MVNYAQILKDLQNVDLLNNRPCQARPTRVNVSSNEPLFIHILLSVNKRGVSCNTIDHIYTRVFVQNKKI